MPKKIPHVRKILQSAELLFAPIHLRGDMRLIAKEAGVSVGTATTIFRTNGYFICLRTYGRRLLASMAGISNSSCILSSVCIVILSIYTRTLSIRRNV